MNEFFIFAYLLIGVLLARADVVYGRNLIFDDSAIHTLFCAILWAAILPIKIIGWVIIFIDMLIDTFRQSWNN